MLTLFHDYTDPASAIAVARLQRLEDEGVAVSFEGFDAVGLDAVLPVTLDVVALLDDLREAADAVQLCLQRPTALPPTAAAHAVGRLAEERGLDAAWRERCYRAFWEEGADISRPATLADLAGAVGLDHAGAAATAADPRALAETRRRGLAHRRNGVGGVPTILAARTLVPGLLDTAALRQLAALGT